MRGSCFGVDGFFGVLLVIFLCLLADLGSRGLFLFLFFGGGVVLFCF